MKKLIDAIEAEQIGDKKHPAFKTGDTVIVNVFVKEGTRTRVQAYEGVVIARRNRGMNSAFTVRKISHGEGVERAFQLYSPQIESITLVRRGDVRRAKIYYLRDLSGKKARIKEKLSGVKAEAKEAKPKATKAKEPKVKEDKETE